MGPYVSCEIDQADDDFCRQIEAQLELLPQRSQEKAYLQWVICKWKALRSDNKLSDVGVMHLLVERITNRGSGILVEARVLAGHQQGKYADLFLPFGKPGDCAIAPKVQEMFSCLLTRFFLATNVLSPLSLGCICEVDESLVVGQQFIAEFEWQKRVWHGDCPIDVLEIGLRFPNVWHVDAPQVRHVAKSVEALNLIDAVDRQKPSWISGFFGPRTGGEG